MHTELVKQRLLDRIEPQIGLRIVPKHLFEGRLGPKERLYVCIGDYEELRGSKLAHAVEILYGGRSDDEEMKAIYGQWVNLGLGAFREKGPEDIGASPEYYVIKLDISSENDLDLFPGTWRAMSYILSDRARMLQALPVYDQFMRIVHGNKPFGQTSKDAVDFYDFVEIGPDDEYTFANSQLEYYQYVAADSVFANTTVGLFGINNRCWHGRGYIGAHGYFGCRVFLVRNVALPHRNLISCELVRRDEYLK